MNAPVHFVGQQAAAAHRMACRSCGNLLSQSVVDLGVQPPCNSLITVETFTAAESFFPLRVKICEHCLLPQLDADVAPEAIYTEYSYFSSFSASWLEHLKRLADELTRRFGLTTQQRAVEIASNDGAFLRNLVERGIPCYGIDPAVNVARIANESGVPTEVGFFGRQMAKRLVAADKGADLIVANNVIGHVPDLKDFIAGIKTLLRPGGTVSIEIPHFMRLLEHGEFDTIYHEHYTYHLLVSDVPLFRSLGLRLFDVQELPTHGGSLRMLVCHEDDPRPTEASVGALMDEERRRGLDRMETYAAFDEKVREAKRDFLQFLIDAKRQGKRIVGYGAPGKGNTFLNYCGIRQDFVDFVVDRNTYKQGKFLPGSRIPILTPDRVAAARPDYLWILPWNLKDEVIEQMRGIREWGGRFVTAVPKLQIWD